jgi:hypothetical protein
MPKATRNFLTIICILIFSVSNLYAASFYVKTGGNDSLDGRSDATAWRTLNKVTNYQFSAGDDVYLKCGGVWNQQRLTINWSGTDSNIATVGSYYVENGQEKIGIKGNKPVVNGNHSLPYDLWLGMVQIQSQHHVLLENIRVINSEGDGFLVNYSNNFTLNNLETDNVYKSGIRTKDSSYAVIKNCVITNTCRIGPEENYSQNWPAALSISQRTHHVTVERCKVYKNWGEGIGGYFSSYSNIIQDNICYANKRVVGVYFAQGSHSNIIRRNLVYGTTDRNFWLGQFPSSGIIINDEHTIQQGGYHDLSTGSSHSNKIYNNYIAFTSNGIDLATQHPESVMRNIEVYKNTVVDSLNTVKFGSMDFTSDVRNLEITDNIFLCKSDDCLPSNKTSTPNTTWSGNYWSNPVSGSLSDRTNIIGGVFPLLKKNGWRNFSGDDLTIKDFSIVESHVPIDNGASTIAEETSPLPLEDNELMAPTLSIISSS